MNPKEFYDRNGFHVHEAALLDCDKVKAARKGMDMIRAAEYDTGTPPFSSQWNPGDDPHALCKIEQPQVANRAISELIRSPELGAHIAAVCGAEMVQVWWVQFLFKPPAVEGTTAATKVGWHQDWTYWNPTWETPSEVLTAWVAVSDVSETSGPMKFVPGSHAWENPGGGDFYSQDEDDQAFAIPEGEAWQEVSASMSAGGCSLHHRMTLHGSSQNRSTAPRCSFAVHVRTEKSRPEGGGRKGFAAHIDSPDICPIIYGDRIKAAF